MDYMGGFCHFVMVIILCIAFLCFVDSTSVHIGEEEIQRQLSESIVGDERVKYESLLVKKSQIRKEIATLSRLLPDESASNRIKELNIELQDIFQESLVLSTQSTGVTTRSFAAQRALERAQRRQAVRRLEEDKVRRQVEDFNYIQNIRKMEIVESAIIELQSRVELHGLNEFASHRVKEMLDEYRQLEANYIFNGTSVLAAQTQRRQIEKFIGDSQSIEITNKQRQKELLDRTIQELAARGVSFMCRSEMKVLDDMLALYREYGLQLIEYSNSKSNAVEEISATQKATQAQKLNIEKYIGTTKSTSKCSSTPKRSFLNTELSA